MLTKDQVAHLREAMKAKCKGYQELLETKVPAGAEFGKAICFYSGGRCNSEAPKRRLVSLCAVDSAGESYITLFEIKSFETFIERCQALLKIAKEQ